MQGLRQAIWIKKNTIFMCNENRVILIYSLKLFNRRNITKKKFLIIFIFERTAN